ncbi:MAG: hypothetical protein P1U89_15470 [Verrucomicrobiales bacterium]|nr:hypothetical protein [Verrucomicrobiales bacterium]
MIWRSILCLLVLTSVGLGEEIRQTLSLKETFKPNETLIWSPGFQKCWDEMRTAYQLDKPTFSVDNPLVDELNGFEWKYEDVVPKGAHFSVLSGTGEEYRKNVNKLLTRHFGELFVPFPPNYFGMPGTRGLVLLSILNHDLYFNTDLKQNVAPFVFRSGEGVSRAVKSFGTIGADPAVVTGAIKVIAYDESARRKAIILGGKDGGEEVVLVVDPSLKSTEDVINSVNAWTEIMDRNQTLARHHNDSSDVVVIPEINLSSDIDLKPLFPGMLDLGNGTLVSIARAGQRVGLKMNRKGTRMVTKSYLVPPTYLSGGDSSGGPVVMAQNRKFIFDQPFFLMLRKKGETYPFLFVKVDQSVLVAKNG